MRHEESPQAPYLINSRFHQLIQIPRGSIVSDSCPTHGCAAPFAVVGDRLKLVDGWYAEGRLELLAITGGALVPDADRPTILDDWSAGRQRVSATLAVKMVSAKVTPCHDGGHSPSR